MVGKFDDETYGGCADSAIWIKMSMKADVGYIPLPMMRITPRISSDRYGEFDWFNVVGMAKAHELGVHNLFKRQPKLLGRKLKFNQFRTDRHFLLILAQWIAKDDQERIRAGLDSINLMSSPYAKIAAKVLVKISSNSQPLFSFLAILYGKTIRTLGRVESLYGTYLSARSSKK